MDTMDTLTEVMEKLRAEGYTTDFNLQKNHLAAKDLKVLHDEFVIDKFYRFEGESDPGDEITLYAITSEKHGIKGLLVNAMGIYSEEIADEILQALDIRKR